MSSLSIFKRRKPNKKNFKNEEHPKEENNKDERTKLTDIKDKNADVKQASNKKEMTKNEHQNSQNTNKGKNNSIKNVEKERKDNKNNKTFEKSTEKGINAHKDEGGKSMLFKTTEQHEALRKAVREFAEAEVKPIAFSLDQNNEFPDEIVKMMGEHGWMGLPYEKKYGGAGLDAISYAIAVEELSRVDGGVGVILSAHTSLGSYPIEAFGTEEQNKNI